MRLRLSLLLLLLLAGCQAAAPMSVPCAAADGAAARGLAEQVAAADLIIHAQITGPAAAAVWAYYKGTGPADLPLIATAADGCAQLPAVGTEALVFLTQSSDNRLVLLPVAAVEDVSPALLQQVEALSGQGPWLPNPPSAALRPKAEPWPGPLSYLGAVILLIAALMTVRARRREQQRDVSDGRV